MIHVMNSEITISCHAVDEYAHPLCDSSLEEMKRYLEWTGRIIWAREGIACVSLTNGVKRKFLTGKYDFRFESFLIEYLKEEYQYFKGWLSCMTDTLNDVAIIINVSIYPWLEQQTYIATPMPLVKFFELMKAMPIIEDIPW